MMHTNIFIILIKLAQPGLIRMYNSLDISFNCWHKQAAYYVVEC